MKKNAKFWVAVALVLCLYSGGIYLYNTFVGSRRNADD